jgi:hypothetical protein
MDIGNIILAACTLSFLALTCYLVFRRGEVFDNGEVISAATHPEQFAMFKLRLSLILLMLAIWGASGAEKHEYVKLGFRPSFGGGLGVLVLASLIATFVIEAHRTGEADFFVGHTKRGDFGFFASMVAGVAFTMLWAALGIAFMFDPFR